MDKVKTKNCVNPQCVRAPHLSGAMGCVLSLTPEEENELIQLVRRIGAAEESLGRLYSRKQHLIRSQRDVQEWRGH